MMPRRRVDIHAAARTPLNCGSSEGRAMSEQPSLSASIEITENRFYSEESVRERDLDHFLIEELQSSDDFRDWFVARIGNVFRPPAFQDVRTARSPFRPDGRQTDLWLAYYDQKGSVAAAILIENKIADGFQPGQPQDYQKEVARWRAELGIDRAAAVLVTPTNNYHVGMEREYFDAFIALEDIADFLASRRDNLPTGELRRRLEVRTSLLLALAGKRTGGGWMPRPDAAVLNDAQVYERLVSHHLPGFSLNPTTAGAESGDRFFGTFPGRLAFNGDVLLKHRVYGGAVCLDFRRAPFLKELAASISLPTDGSIRLRWTGRHSDTLQIRMTSPALPRKCSEQERAKLLIAGLKVVREMTEWFAQHLTDFNRAVD
jgi:hypothetical protein